MTDAAAEVDTVPTDIHDAIRIVLRKSLEVNGLLRGLSEVARAMDRKAAHIVFLAEDCEDPKYKKLIEALSQDRHVDIIMVKERAKLAEWAGLCKVDRAGNVKKTFKCSCVAITEFGEQTKALELLLDKLK